MSLANLWAFFFFQHKLTDLRLWKQLLDGGVHVHNEQNDDPLEAKTVVSIFYSTTYDPLLIAVATVNNDFASRFHLVRIPKQQNRSFVTTF